MAVMWPVDVRLRIRLLGIAKAGLQLNPYCSPNRIPRAQDTTMPPSIKILIYTSLAPVATKYRIYDPGNIALELLSKKYNYPYATKARKIRYGLIALRLILLTYYLECSRMFDGCC